MNLLLCSEKKSSNSLFVCTFVPFTVVECGRVQTILKGEIVYVNSTTYLGSELHYSCGTGYRLAGNKIRVCLDDDRSDDRSSGRWSGSKPKCEEIRCQTPQIPKNSSVSYNGNDRSFADSFKVGSTVQYRCSAGHIVSGQSLRTCETSGHWSDSPPHCVCKFMPKQTQNFSILVPFPCFVLSFPFIVPKTIV